MKTLAMVAAAATLAAGSAAFAQAPTAQAPTPGYGSAVLAQYDARIAPDLPSKLAICDAARFLRSSPDLDADKIFVRRNDNRLDLLLPPNFVGGPQWYDEDIERAYRRLKSQGQVSYDEVKDARYRIGREMVRAFERTTGAERQYLDDQSRYCEEVEDFGKA